MSSITTSHFRLGKKKTSTNHWAEKFDLADKMATNG